MKKTGLSAFGLGLLFVVEEDIGAMAGILSRLLAGEGVDIKYQNTPLIGSERFLSMAMSILSTCLQK